MMDEIETAIATLRENRAATDNEELARLLDECIAIAEEYLDRWRNL